MIKNKSNYFIKVQFFNGFLANVASLWQQIEHCTLDSREGKHNVTH